MIIILEIFKNEGMDYGELKNNWELRINELIKN
jgi:hypothetical protein